MGNKARVSAHPETIQTFVCDPVVSLVSPISDQDSDNGNEDELVSDKKTCMIVAGNTVI
jgi:hypothetical protein